MNYKIIQIEKENLNLIKPLWEKLNQIHLKDSKYFKDHFKTFTFEKRIEKFAQIEEQNIYVEIVQNENNIPSGYCISTVDGKKGEIDSVYIEKEIRKSGLGRKLVENGISWMKKIGCEKIIVGVAEGHEEVFDFYIKLGFYPRMSYLELKR